MKVTRSATILTVALAIALSSSLANAAKPEGPPQEPGSFVCELIRSLPIEPRIKQEISIRVCGRRGGN